MTMATLAGDCPQAVPLTCVVALLHRVVALFLGRLARPYERRSDGGTQLAPLAVGLGASRRVRGAIQYLEGLLVGGGDCAPLEVLERGVVPAYLAVGRHGTKPLPFAPPECMVEVP